MTPKKQDIKNTLLTPTSTKADHSMKVATFVGVGFHLLLIFGISFTTGKSPAALAQEVATALTQNTEVNEEAKFIADGAQKGSGVSEKSIRQSTSQISPLTDSEMQETQDIVNQKKQIRQRLYQESYLLTTLSYREVEKDSNNDDKNKEKDLEEQQERVRKEISTLEAQLTKQDQVLSANTNTVTVDSNSTTYNKTSLYLDNFREHVERTAEHYYPQTALSKNITGDVRLMIIIDFDGNVKAIRLLESSGSKVLDEAAKQSVRQSAPYGKFNEEMKDVEQLRIIRTWRYSGDISIR